MKLSDMNTTISRLTKDQAAINGPVGHGSYMADKWLDAYAALTPAPQPAGEAVPLPVGWSSEMDAHPPQPSEMVAESVDLLLSEEIKPAMERAVKLVGVGWGSFRATLRALKGGEANG